MFLIPAIANLDMILGADNDVMGFARMMNRDRSVQRLASEYFQTNIFVGVSPFSPRQNPDPRGIGDGRHGELLGSPVSSGPCRVPYRRRRVHVRGGLSALRVDLRAGPRRGR